jgi:hypothetical protein
MNVAIQWLAPVLRIRKVPGTILDLKANYSLLAKRSEVLTAVKMSILVFWVVTPCGLVGRYQRFGRAYYLCLQGRVSPSYSTLNMDAIRSSETPVSHVQDCTASEPIRRQFTCISYSGRKLICQDTSNEFEERDFLGLR